jgi:hypothetical protein
VQLRQQESPVLLLGVRIERMTNDESGADHLQHVSTIRLEISGGGARIDEGLDRLSRPGGDGLGRDHISIPRIDACLAA